jgi:iron complex outermembrane receptor protein
MAHLDINDYVKPYADFSFMYDRTTEIVGPSALFQTNYPFTPDDLYRVNCSNPLLSAQEQGILCTPAQIAASTANPGSAAGLATLDIGRRNIEGGGRIERLRAHQLPYRRGRDRTVVGWPDL